MKIIDNVLRPFSIDDLGEGATFKYGNEYFLKLYREIRDEHGPLNAVRLTDGVPLLFRDDVAVIPFSCELIVL